MYKPLLPFWDIPDQHTSLVLFNNCRDVLSYYQSTDYVSLHVIVSVQTATCDGPRKKRDLPLVSLRKSPLSSRFSHGRSCLKRRILGDDRAEEVGHLSTICKFFQFSLVVLHRKADSGDVSFYIGHAQKSRTIATGKSKMSSN